MVRQLTIVAGLIAADHARKAVWKECSLQGQRIGVGAETAAAVADDGRPDKIRSSYKRI